MSTYERDRLRKKLREFLSKANDEEFFQLVWAVDALQSGREEVMRRYIRYPPEAASEAANYGSPYAAYKWDLETLLNQLLITPKYEMRPGRNQLVSCDTFETAAHGVYLLRKLENAEAGVYLKRVGIFTEMHRIGHRQFPWQRGYADIVNLYRHAFIFGSEDCAAYFERKAGLSLSRFMLVGFCLFAAFLNDPWLGQPYSMAAVGVSEEELSIALRLLALPAGVARQRAAEQVRKMNEILAAPLPTAYQPSLLRSFPIVAFGERNERLRAPLPLLIIQRITAGVYYDLVDAPPALRNEPAARFKRYCAEHLQKSLPELTTGRSYQYSVGRMPFDTPDLLIRKGKELVVVAECKATKLSLPAQFADDPIAEATRSYEEIAKGVFQIWRFFSHIRRGLAPGELGTQSTLGLIITLDNWLRMAGDLRGKVLAAAGDLANEDDQITPEDRRSIVFCTVEDLETTLSRCDESLFLRTLAVTNEPKFNGWMLQSICTEIPDAVMEKKPFPFDLGEVIPWWRVLGDDESKATAG